MCPAIHVHTAFNLNLPEEPGMKEAPFQKFTVGKHVVSEKVAKHPWVLQHTKTPEQVAADAKAELAQAELDKAEADANAAAAQAEIDTANGTDDKKADDKPAGKKSGKK